MIWYHGQNEGWCVHFFRSFIRVFTWTNKMDISTLILSVIPYHVEMTYVAELVQTTRMYVAQIRNEAHLSAILMWKNSHVAQKYKKTDISAILMWKETHVAQQFGRTQGKMDTLLATGLRLLCPWRFVILTSLAVYLHLPWCCCHLRSEKMSGCLSLVDQDQATMIYNGSGNTLSGLGHVLKVWSWSRSSSCSSKYVLNKKSWTEWNEKAAVTTMVWWWGVGSSFVGLKTWQLASDFRQKKNNFLF